MGARTTRTLRAFPTRAQTMTDTTTNPVAFDSLGLPPFLLESLSVLGYEEATPIQAETVPALLEGRDVVGIAQTGTGKTAAFALPGACSTRLQKPSPPKYWSYVRRASCQCKLLMPFVRMQKGRPAAESLRSAAATICGSN